MRHIWLDGAHQGHRWCEVCGLRVVRIREGAWRWLLTRGESVEFSAVLPPCEGRGK